MRTPAEPKLTALARGMRKNPTREERRLWYDCLKKLPYRVNRQHCFGSYIADFYVPEAGLIIEVDGSQHYSERGRRRDMERERALNALGLAVIRYTNYDVKTNFEGVCINIKNRIEERKGHRANNADWADRN